MKRLNNTLASALKNHSNKSPSSQIGLSRDLLAQRFKKFRAAGGTDNNQNPSSVASTSGGCTFKIIRIVSFVYNTRFRFLQ